MIISFYIFLVTWCKIWCIAKNPFENTTLPKIKRKPREIWDAATIRKALDECKDGRLYVAINLSFACSLRIGEIVGLTWDNIHISDADIASDNAYLCVEKELVRVREDSLAVLGEEEIIKKFPRTMYLEDASTVIVLKTPKTESSVRKVWIPKTVAYILREWKASQDKQKEFLGSEYLDYNEVMEKYEQMMRWLAKVYVNALKIIHYMHDKYDYEAYEMALHDGDVQRIRATGIAGLSIVADSLAAIRDCKVKVIRDERGLAVDFEREGEYVPYGNNDDRTDAIAVEITEKFMNYLRQHETYRNAVATQSILTITSNVVYGKKTGTTPDGRQGGTPFAPGANPMNGRDVKGAVAALASVAKLPFHHAHDGISYTFAISPATLGKERDIQVSNLVGLLDGYFTPDGGQHLNVNVFDKDLLVDAMEHPEKYPQLTIRVSGYAVNFVKLTREQQLDVISRTINHSL